MDSTEPQPPNLSFAAPKTTLRRPIWRSALAHMMHGSTVTKSVHAAKSSTLFAANIRSMASSSACRVALRLATVLLWPRPRMPRDGWTNTQPTGVSETRSAASASASASPISSWSEEASIFFCSRGTRTRRPDCVCGA